MNSACASLGGSLDVVTPVLDAPDASAWRGLGKSPFTFRHRLSGHPLFQRSQLEKLAVLAAGRASHFGYLSPEEKRMSAAERARCMVARMAELATGHHWLKLSFVNQLLPDYEALLQDLLKEVEVLSGQTIRRRAVCAGMSVFLNSPHLRVPYHFDHDTNFLLQLEGEKDVVLFDAEDPAVLTQAELEDFYRGNALAGRYHDGLRDAGHRYRLSPGVGVHHPPLAPHMVENGDHTSVSVSMFYILPEQSDRGRTHQANYLLRKVGLNPRPPGTSAWSDRVKSSVIGAFSTSHPQSYEDLLYSGIIRITRPLQVAQRAASKLRRGP